MSCFVTASCPFWAAALSGASADAEELIFKTRREHQTVDLTNRRSTFDDDKGR